MKAGICCWAVLYDRVGLGADAEDDVDRPTLGGRNGLGNWGTYNNFLDGGPLN